MLRHRRTVGALHDYVRLGEALLHLAVPHLDVLDQVSAGAVRVQLRRIRLQGIARVGHRLQHLVLHIDQRQRLPCDLRRLRRHQRNRIAHVARRIRAPGKDRPVVFHQAVARVARHIGACQHRVHARQRARPLRVDPDDARVRMFAAQRRPEEHPLEVVVVRVQRRARHLVNRVRPRVRLPDLRQRLHHLRQFRLRHPARAHKDTRRLHRADDRLVARAAAVGIFQTLLDLDLARLRVLVQQRLRLHDETGRAEPALRRSVLDKGRLQRVQFQRLLPLPSLCQPLDRQHIRPLRFERRVDARVDRLPVDNHRAAAALRLIAPDLRAGQPQVVAQDLRQKAAGRHVEDLLRAVDSQSQFLHNAAPVSPRHR